MVVLSFMMWRRPTCNLMSLCNFSARFASQKGRSGTNSSARNLTRSSTLVCFTARRLPFTHSKVGLNGVHQGAHLNERLDVSPPCRFAAQQNGPPSPCWPAFNTTHSHKQVTHEPTACTERISTMLLALALGFGLIVMSASVNIQSGRGSKTHVCTDTTLTKPRWVLKLRHDMIYHVMPYHHLIRKGREGQDSTRKRKTANARRRQDIERKKGRPHTADAADVTCSECRNEKQATHVNANRSQEKLWRPPSLCQRRIFKLRRPDRPPTVDGTQYRRALKEPDTQQRPLRINFFVCRL